MGKSRALLISSVAVGICLVHGSLVASELPVCSLSDVNLTVSPTQPGCSDSITLGAEVTLTDSCWSVYPPIFSATSPDFNWAIDRFDGYAPPAGCTHIVLTIPFTQTVGPLEVGPYSLKVDFTSTSPRQGDYACSSWIPFDVTCCPELPMATDGLLLTKTNSGSEILLNWHDVPGADDYVIFGSAVLDGSFTHRVAVGPTGLTGVRIDVSQAMDFLLVAARNNCGMGPRR